MFETTKYKRLILQLMIFCASALFFLCTTSRASDFAYFDTKDLDESNDKGLAIEPWKIIKLDPEYGGLWVVAGDVDGDGEVEIISAENVNIGDVHYTSTVVAQKLDGSVLWRWGKPQIGRKSWHHDVACQIHDWNGDGKNEVVLCDKGSIVELDGATGRVLRKISIAEDATDCLVFCNLSGGDHAGDVLVKNRYHQIWAYDYQGKLLWTVKDPGGYRTAHQPRPIDIDGDGRDEIMAGYALLNYDGSVRWVYKSKIIDQSRGHLDCARVFRRAKRVEDFRIVLTCCGADNIAMVDGSGKTLWEIAGHHFESIDVGRIIPGHPGKHILVDIDHQPYGKSPLWVLDEKGKLLGQVVTNYSRHHCLLDWTGDGFDEILLGHNNGLYDHRGRRIGTFITPGLKNPRGKMGYEKSILRGDMTGDGVPDIIIATPDAVYIYKNTNGKKTDKPSSLGTVFNFSLY